MFVSPETIVPRFNLRRGMVVADLGVGSGAYVWPLAHAVGQDGKVYAIDIQKELLARVKTEATERRLQNVEVIWGDIEQPNGAKLKDGIADLVLLSNVLFQVNSAYALALEAKRLVKPDGAVAIIDWTDSFGNLGPRPDRVVTEDKARQIFDQAGFAGSTAFPAGDHHYGLILKLKRL